MTQSQLVASAGESSPAHDPDVRAARSDVQQDGRAIRRLRVKRLLRPEDLAQIVGCHPKALGHIERQTRGASDLMLERIAQALGVDSDLLRRKTA